MPAPARAEDGETPPRNIVVVTPEDSVTAPKLGEYVYVEVLPEAIEKVQPDSPDPAASGTVLLQVLVRRDGRVGDVRIVKSIPALDAAAVEAARRWVFKPALSKGQPVPVWVAVPIRFPPSR